MLFISTSHLILQYFNDLECLHQGLLILQQRKVVLNLLDDMILNFQIIFGGTFSTQFHINRNDFLLALLKYFQELLDNFAHINDGLALDIIVFVGAK